MSQTDAKTNKKLKPFNTENQDPYIKALFEGLDNTSIRILVILTKMNGQLYSQRGIAQMIQKSTASVNRALRILEEKQYINVVNGRYYRLRTATIIIGGVQEVEHQCSTSGTEVFKKLNESVQEVEHNISKNNTKNNSKECVHPPSKIAELLDAGKTMKQQLQSAHTFTDEKGRERVKLDNGKLQLIEYENIFLSDKEVEKVKAKYEQEFGKESMHYLKGGLEKFNGWVVQNKTKALKLKSHYHCLIGWVFEWAMTQSLTDIQKDNAEAQQQRYGR